jgi:chemotaxis protein histidine kinase CheA
VEKEVCIEVMDKDGMGGDDSIGCARVSLDESLVAAAGRADGARVSMALSGPDGSAVKNKSGEASHVICVLRLVMVESGAPGGDEKAEQKAKEEAELKAKQEAETLKAKEEAELKAKQEAETLKAKQVAELKAKEEAEQKSKQEAELKAKQEAETLKAKEEIEATVAAAAVAAAASAQAQHEAASSSVASRLRVLVERGSGFTGSDGMFGGKLDPFVRVRLCSKEDDSVLVEARSKTVNNDDSPAWGETVELELPHAVESTAGLELQITVLDEDTISKDDALAACSVPLPAPVVTGAPAARLEGSEMQSAIKPAPKLWITATWAL